MNIHSNKLVLILIFSYKKYITYITTYSNMRMIEIKTRHIYIYIYIYI